jgi:hypothetical protein
MPNLQNNCRVLSPDRKTEFNLLWITNGDYKSVEITIIVPGGAQATVTELAPVGNVYAYEYDFIQGTVAYQHPEHFSASFDAASPIEVKVYKVGDGGGSSQAHASALL